MSGEDANKVLGDYSHFLSYAERKASHEDAEDAVQEAFLELVKRPSLNYNNPKAAMMRIVHNELLDLRRKSKKTRFEELSFDQIVPRERANNDMSGLVFALYWAIDDLPENQRSVVRDRLDGLSYEEICAKYHISAPSARARFFRACSSLKEKLIAYELKTPEEKAQMPLLESSVA